MYLPEGGSDEKRPWAPWGSDVWEGDTIVMSCVGDRVSLVATRTSHASYLPERFGSGWEISCRERRNELAVTRQFGLVDTRENAIQFLNECRTAINQATGSGESVDSVVVSSIVDSLATDSDVPIVRPPEGVVRNTQETIDDQL